MGVGQWTNPGIVICRIPTHLGTYEMRRIYVFSSLLGFVMRCEVTSIIQVYDR